MPSFLHGTYASVNRKAMREGRRCAEQYRKSGSFSAPGELLEVPPSEPVVLEGVVDFQREFPAWRLYMLSRVKEGLYKALDWQEPLRVSDLYEAALRETPWGALYYATSHWAPMEVGRVALRLEAVLRFWDSLHSACYLFSSPSASLSLEELMTDACGWAMTAWCPEGGGTVRMRLGVAAERMGRATKQDSIEAILRQWPRTLPSARGLAHPEALANPTLWRERLATLDPESFARISAAWPANLLQRLYLWDRQMGVQ
jgi:hypothetical protein